MRITPGQRRAVGGPRAVLLAGVLVVPSLVPVPPGSAAAGWGATVWSDGHVAVVEVGDGSSPIEVLDVLPENRHGPRAHLAASRP